MAQKLLIENTDKAGERFEVQFNPERYTIERAATWEELQRRPRLTPDEEMEAKRLKKLKLRLKDQIERLRRISS